MKKYRILTIDGGGIRGLITAILLERLEREIPGFLSEVDLFAGTSTGGLIALGLASGLNPTQARRIYEEKGDLVFKMSIVRKILALGNLIGAKYSLNPLKEELSKQFGELKLDDLPKKVLISSFDLDNSPVNSSVNRQWKAKFFHNYPGSDSDGKESVIDVAIRTANAPTYFPIFQGYIDGGVVANNPSMCALAQAIHPQTGGERLSDIVLISFGTGHNPHYIPVQYGDWGVLHWATKIINLVTEGSAGLADYQCRQLLGTRYLRVNPLLPYSIAMDQVDEIPRMVEIGNKFDLSEAASWIREIYLT